MEEPTDFLGTREKRFFIRGYLNRSLELDNVRC